MRATTSDLRQLACVAALLSFLGTAVAHAADPENCLSCHRYSGLARIAADGQHVRLFGLDPRYYDRALGPHARLRCTDCHSREEVGVIPHRTVSPVNCTSACHLSVPDRAEIDFDHSEVLDHLDDSVHTTEVLEESNRLIGSPLRTGQSECLLCHDEPIFRQDVDDYALHDVRVDRCRTCHELGLIGIPRDVEYYFHHVYARSKPERSHQALVAACAICHSNARVREHYKLSDTTASYLESFHGKAMLLGSDATAGCLDCHTRRARVHDMLSHEDSRAPTNREQLATTCRSARCHPDAGQFVSSAAVHLDLSQSRGIYRFIAVLFVVLILFTFGPSVVLTALELLQIVVGRHDPDYAEDRKTADVLLRIPQGQLALRRFTFHQRLQHWTLAVLFTALVLTGFPLKFADRTWAEWAAGLLGGVINARHVHRWAGVLLILGFAYHMIYIVVTAWHTKRQTGKSLGKLIMDLPMVMNLKDIKDLFHLLGFLLFLRKTRPAGDRFSLKEKFEYFGVFWGCCLLGVTGVLMWANAWTTQYLPGRVLTVATLIHTFEAFLALIHVGVIHMIGVILSPAVFPLSRAMFTGDTPVKELAETHAGFVRDADHYLDKGEAFGV